jgi:hypothetical protein
MHGADRQVVELDLVRLLHEVRVFCRAELKAPNAAVRAIAGGFLSLSFNPDRTFL